MVHGLLFCWVAAGCWLVWILVVFCGCCAAYGSTFAWRFFGWRVGFTCWMVWFGLCCPVGLRWWFSLGACVLCGSRFCGLGFRLLWVCGFMFGWFLGGSWVPWFLVVWRDVICGFRV